MALEAWRFAPNLARRLVFSQSNEDGVPQQPVFRPVQIGDLRDQLRANCRRLALCRRAWKVAAESSAAAHWLFVAGLNAAWRESSWREDGRRMSGDQVRRALASPCAKRVSPDSPVLRSLAVRTTLVSAMSACVLATISPSRADVLFQSIPDLTVSTPDNACSSCSFAAQPPEVFDKFSLGRTANIDDIQFSVLTNYQFGSYSYRFPVDVEVSVWTVIPAVLSNGTLGVLPERDFQ
jgi:hypothetical protein